MMPRSPFVVLGLSLVGVCASCDPPPPHDAGSRPPVDAAPARPARPQLAALPPDQPDSHACFPADFETTRARIRGDHLELCGLTRGAPRCYSVDPITSFVHVIEVADAPRERPAQPLIEAPLARSEVSSRGARGDTRGGTLSVSSPTGESRTINAQTVGLHSMDNGVLAPWGDGWFIAVFGVRAPDFGASAIVETGKIRLRGRAAFSPCPAGG